MDKEALERIAKTLYERFNGEYWEDADAPSIDYFWSMAHLVLTTIKGLGYHKLPKEKPPLLDEIDMRKALKDACKFWASTKNEDKDGCLLKNLRDIEQNFIAQAQRELDIKHYEEVSDNSH